MEHGFGGGVVCLRHTGAQNGALSNTTPWTRPAVPVSLFGFAESPVQRAFARTRRGFGRAPSAPPLYGVFAAKCVPRGIRRHGAASRLRRDRRCALAAAPRSADGGRAPMPRASAFAPPYADSPGASPARGGAPPFLAASGPQPRGETFIVPAFHHSSGRGHRNPDAMLDAICPG